jgi:uncharacterized protein (UPF0548 family)
MAERRPLADSQARRALDELHRLPVNFEVSQWDWPTPEHGWRVDQYRRALPAEPPGEPLPYGSWAIAKRLASDYEFADPRIVRAVYHADVPLAERDMLIEGRFYGLRFYFGCRVGGVIDDLREEVDGPVRRWGWNYRTLQGHLEMGQMDFLVVKLLDSGGVEFRISAVSRAATPANPVVRLGLRLFGRHMQVKFARRALDRMERLTRAELARAETACGQPARGHPARREPARAAHGIEIGPAASRPRLAHKLRRSQHRS